MAISGRVSADVAFASLNLQPVLCGYELVFALKVSVNGGDTSGCGVSIAGAEIKVGSAGGRSVRCGFARPDGVFELRQCKFSTSSSVGAVLPMHPGQVAALEALRGTGDLDFELVLVGRLEEGEDTYNVTDTIHHREPRSNWIELLRHAGARDVLLIEVGLPFHSETDGLNGFWAELRRAEERFRHGDYQGCIAGCRAAVEDLGRKKYGTQTWAAKCLDRLESNRKGMSESEREGAVWSAVRHYAHQAHHGHVEGGVVEYSRGQAQWVLAATAAFAARAAPVTKQ